MGLKFSLVMGGVGVVVGVVALMLHQLTENGALRYEINDARSAALRAIEQRDAAVASAERVNSQVADLREEFSGDVDRVSALEREAQSGTGELCPAGCIIDLGDQ